MNNPFDNNFNNFIDNSDDDYIDINDYHYININNGNGYIFRTATGNIDHIDNSDNNNDNNNDNDNDNTNNNNINIVDDKEEEEDEGEEEKDVDMYDDQINESQIKYDKNKEKYREEVENTNMDDNDKEIEDADMNDENQEIENGELDYEDKEEIEDEEDADIDDEDAGMDDEDADIDDEDAGMDDEDAGMDDEDMEVEDDDDMDDNNESNKKKNSKYDLRTRKRKRQSDDQGDQDKKRRKLAKNDLDIPPEIIHTFIDVLKEKLGEKNRRWLTKCTPEELKIFKPAFEKIDTKIKERLITERDIMKSSMSFEDKVEIMEEFRVLNSYKKDTQFWLDLKRKLYKKISDTTFLTDEDRIQVTRLKNIGKTTDPVPLRILKANIPDDIKSIIWKRYEEIKKLGESDSGYLKGINWINRALNIPRNIINIKEKYSMPFNLINKIYTSMEKKLYGQYLAKNKIIEMICAMWSNPNTKKKMVGFIGPPGSGKTAFARHLADSMGLPFYQISLGGARDPSFLKGHHFTYVGSESGEIAKALGQMKAKNGILFFDELDKIQDTPNGQEVTSTLLHILDYTQNHEFKDDYLSGIPIDLSQLIIILAINDVRKIDKVLLDRLQLTQFTNYTKIDKINIGYNFMIPKIMKNLNMNPNDIVITKDSVKYIVSKSGIEEYGVRQLERNLSTILERVNTLKQINIGKQGNQNSSSIQLKYNIPNFRLPIVLNRENIDKLFYEYDRNYSEFMTNEDRTIVNRFQDEKDINKPIYSRIIKANIPDNIKSIIWNKYKEIKNLKENDPEYIKVTKWLNHALKIPHNIIDIKEKYNLPFDLIKKVYSSMEKNLYGQQSAKEKIIDMISAMWSNPNTKKKMVGFIGPPGTGKTAFARHLADAMGLPFYQIALGGTKDASFLKGHSATYLGSECGEVAKAMESMKAKNGILFFDELDKLQNTPRGQEVVSTLLHILDYTQNHEFKDEYLSGIPIDLSQLVIILAINDVSKIDKILLDRLQLTQFDEYTRKDKVNIGYGFMIPKIMKNLNMNPNDIVITKESVSYIVSKSRIEEKGVRQLERNLSTILGRFNTLKQINIGNKNTSSIKLKYNIPNFKLPLVLNRRNIDILFSEHVGKNNFISRMYM